MRYIVDRPRGPRGGNNDSPAMYRAIGPARRNAAPRSSRWDSDGDRQPGRVLAFDLDALLPVDATIDEHFEWHERMALHHGGELLRLRPENSSPPVPGRSWPWLNTTDLARLREAAAAWIDTFPRRDAKHPRKPEDSALLFLLKSLLEDGKL